MSDIVFKQFTAYPKQVCLSKIKSILYFDIELEFKQLLHIFLFFNHNNYNRDTKNQKKQVM